MSFTVRYQSLLRNWVLLGRSQHKLRISLGLPRNIEGLHSQEVCRGLEIRSTVTEAKDKMAIHWEEIIPIGSTSVGSTQLKMH